MSKTKISLIPAISAVAVGAFASDFFSAPGHVAGFGPAVASDATLNANLGVGSRRSPG